MRKLLLIVAVLSFAACSRPAPTPYEIARKNIEDYLKPHLHDPSSYEFVSLDSLSVVSEYDSIENEIERSANSQEKYLEDYWMMKASLDVQTLYNTKEEAEAKIKAALSQRENDSLHNIQIRKEEDSLIKAIPKEKKNTPAYYLTFFKARAKNSFGALIMNTYLIKLDKNLHVIEFHQQK